MLSFENERFLLVFLLLLIPLALFVRALYKKKAIKRLLGDKDLIGQLTRPYSKRRYLLKFLLAFFGLFFLASTIASLVGDEGDRAANTSGADLMIVLDLSKSMLAKDILPSRLERSKQFIKELIKRPVYNRIGLVAFAGKAFLEMPLTTDRDAVSTALGYLDPNGMPVGGTNINEALKVAADALNTHRLQSRLIVLITDGEDKDGLTSQMADQLREKKISVYTIGVGTNEGASIEDSLRNYKKDRYGTFVVSKLNETLLSQIAQKTGGAFLKLIDNSQANTELAASLSEHNTGKEDRDTGSAHYALYPFFLLIAIILLILEIFIPETKKLAV